MCDGMRIDRRLVLIGVMLVVLSMTMATQYATTEISYSFAIVHPSDSDIRFIGSDNSSDDQLKVLRVTNNDSGSQFLTIELGEWTPGTRKNYTAAFGIVNEEQWKVNISYMNITGTNNSYVTIWLHGDRDLDYQGEGAASVKMIREGTALYTSTDTAWSLGAGNQNPDNMCGGENGATQITTPWATASHVKYSYNNANNSVNGTSDFVWVGVSIYVPPDAKVQTATGTIYIHFRAD